MKRVILGFVWFLVIWFGTLIIGGAMAGALAGSQVGASSSVSESYEKGYAAGQQAGAEFASRFGRIIFIGALVIAVGGTIAGVLPGTKPKKDS